MDYKSMSEEYYQTAEALKCTLEKYEGQLKIAKSSKRDYIRAMVAKYRSLYKEVLSTAVLLERRANGEFVEWD